MAIGVSALAFTTYSLLNKQQQATADNTKTHTLFAWGQGIKGQLGVGLVQFGVPAPTIIESLQNQEI